MQVETIVPYVISPLELQVVVAVGFLGCRQGSGTDLQRCRQNLLVQWLQTSLSWTTADLQRSRRELQPVKCNVEGRAELLLLGLPNQSGCQARNWGRGLIWCSLMATSVWDCGQSWTERWVPEGIGHKLGIEEHTPMAAVLQEFKQNLAELAAQRSLLL